MLWARANPGAFLCVLLLRYAGLLAALMAGSATALLTAGLALLLSTAGALLVFERGAWRSYFVRPLAGSLVLYALVTEIRILAHSLL